MRNLEILSYFRMSTFITGKKPVIQNRDITPKEAYEKYFESQAEQISNEKLTIGYILSFEQKAAGYQNKLSHFVENEFNGLVEKRNQEIEQMKYYENLINQLMDDSIKISNIYGRFRYIKNYSKEIFSKLERSQGFEDEISNKIDYLQQKLKNGPKHNNEYVNYVKSEIGDEALGSLNKIDELFVNSQEQHMKEINELNAFVLEKVKASA